MKVEVQPVVEYIGHNTYALKVGDDIRCTAYGDAGKRFLEAHAKDITAKR